MRRDDTRGHGRSEVPAGPYAIEPLSDDVLTLMDLLEIGHAHFCGVSIGGVTAWRSACARHVAFDALHLPNIEQAALFTQTVLDFLRGA